MQTKAVIFDMDGVLLDSEPYYYDYLNQRFSDLGLSVTDEEYNTFVGLPSRKVWSYLETSRGMELGIEDLMKVEEEQINEIFRNSTLKPMDGIPDLLESLSNYKVPMSVASSSYKSTIELIVEKLGINDYFRFLVSGTEVRNGKPHPDIFLRSADLLGISPKNCLVIEDSHNGLTGARKAGMKCVGFKNQGSGNQDLSGADIIISEYNKKNIQSVLDLLGI